jgi:4-hydroxybenzoate polyprenyltransferase
MALLSRRLLPALQLTRMALVFTALADSGCALLLWAANQARPLGQSIWKQLEIRQCISLAAVSVGLYGFGMSLNDIIDRRRDRQISPNRPLPSGRIGVTTAQIMCALLILMALWGGEVYSSVVQGSQLSLILVVITAALIAFYDFLAKYLVGPGLVALGLIRFFHATVAAPGLPVFWHPLLLLNHVTIVSTLAYHWEKKRPALKPVHWWSIFTALFCIDWFVIGLIWWRRHERDPLLPVREILSLQPQLLGPVAAVGVFALVAIWIRKRNPNPRHAGQTVMLAGLLWLIVYDALFAAGFANLSAGIAILIFLPMAYCSVLAMRAWNRVILLSQRPEFKRIET